MRKTIDGPPRAMQLACAFALPLLWGCGRSPARDASADAALPDTVLANALGNVAQGRLGPGSFALTDSEGVRLVALDSLSSPIAIQSAICGNGLRLPVSYVRTQPLGATDTGRQTAQNFQNVPGAVYQVTDGVVPPDATCYLTADSGLAASAAPVTASGQGKCEEEWPRQLAVLRGREVSGCWPLAAAATGARFFTVQFVPVDTSALASIVVVDAGQYRFLDFPARYSGPDSDTWRAGDAGGWFVAGFQVLFVAKPDDVLVVGLTWSGEEGENAYLLAADSGAALRTVAHGYRYWVPE